MSVLGHVAVGCAVARLEALGTDRKAQRPGGLAVPGRYAIYTAAALLPDIDLLFPLFGASGAGSLGHRGATHSFVAAGLLGLACAAFVPGDRLRLWMIVGLVIASHGILDALSTGDGAMLFWPFSSDRIASPVQPLPIPPIGPRLFTVGGLALLAAEFAWFIPVWLVAFLPLPRRMLPGRTDH